MPALISPEDLSSCPDEYSVMTYVAYFKSAQRQQEGPKIAPHLDNPKDRQTVQADPSPVQEPAAAPAPEPTSAKGTLPPPWERAGNWRQYKGPDLGGQCKIRVYFSTTTSSAEVRKNSQELMQLLERLKVHERPDFEPWIPVDIDMTKEKRDAIFEKVLEK